jgi:outer membrane protein, heavy metal efflux system
VRTLFLLLLVPLCGTELESAVAQPSSAPTSALAADTAGLPASASVAPAMSIRAAFEAAWRRAVTARESAGATLRAEAERSSASNVWAAPPSLELSQRSDRWQDAAGRRENEIAIAWPMWLPGQRAARVASAESGARLTDATLASARLRLAGEVREAAWAVVSHRADARLAGEQAGYLQRLAEDVARRVAAGDLARADSLAARAEWLNATSAASDARLQFSAALSQWKLLTGQDALPDPNETAPATTITTAEHPDAAIAAASEARSRRQLDVAKQSKYAPPEIMLRYREDVPGTGLAAQRSIGFGIRIPLGSSEQGTAQLANALANRNVAELQAIREQERLDAANVQARAAVESAEQRLQADRSRAELLRERTNLIEKSFKAGESSLADLLRATAASAQASAAVARQEAAAGLARARLLQANGQLP